MKNFALVYAALAAFALTFAACSGDAGTDGTADQVVNPVQTGGDNVIDPANDPDNVKPVDDPSDPVKDPEGTEDPVDDPITYPEPGTVEYWLDIIPGTWRQSPDCKTPEQPSKCETELSVASVDDVPDGTLGCPDSDWIIAGNFGGGVNALCLEDNGTLSMCKNLDCIKADGAIIESVQDEGTCSQKADGMPTSCVRHSDCADVLPSATCTNMKVEYWIDFCTWSNMQGSCEGGNTYSYMRIP